MLTFTEMGFDVVLSDVDTVWLQDPLPYLARYPEADILVSSDSLVSSSLHVPAVTRRSARLCSLAGYAACMTLEPALLFI